MTPWRSKKFLLTTCGPKNLAKPEITPLEPLDLLATVGQSCVCVRVSVLVSVSVCVEERRFGVVTLKSPKKTHFSLPEKLLSLSLSPYQQQTNSLCVTFYHIHNHKMNGSFTFIP